MPHHLRPDPGARLNDQPPHEAHPEFEAERAYIQHAYLRLDEIRADAAARAATHARTRGSTFQATYERDVAVRVALERARSLDIGDESLVFGRTDHESGARHYIGRRAVFDRNHEPLVIDWRVPASEPFYRATGRHPLGLTLRRHFLCEGRRLQSIEDEHLGEGIDDVGLAGTGALMSALERPRTGTMHDIVATVQAEQDEIIRADLPGVLAVQGGPGTGKTAVALHRAAFLLFTHRKKLGQQGILFVGPNSRFLRYIERVLPALGESGATLVTLEDLVPGVRVRSAERGDVARVKGGARMAEVIARAVRDRQRALERDAVIAYDAVDLVLTARESAELVASAEGSSSSHNARHAALKSILVGRLYQQYVRKVRAKHGDLAELMTIRRKPAVKALRRDPGVAAMLEAIWPLLSPQRLVGDLLGSRLRLESAAGGVLAEGEIALLYREEPNAWTHADIALLDEAFTHLGATERRARSSDEDADEVDQIETYGHVVADEVQDLSPMALRMLARRARTGSMTIVGDLAQAVGALLPGSWDDVLRHLPARAGQRVAELTINYRTPGSIMDLAERVLRAAAPGLEPPRSVRPEGVAVAFARGDVMSRLAEIANAHRADGTGTMVVIAPPSMLAEAGAAARAIGDLGAAVIALSVEDAKGLEFDEVVVVEPARIVEESAQGLRAIYVALTRATHRATIVHGDELPPIMREPSAD